MASREELESLRQLARKRHRAATQKASRLRSKGVEVAGTKDDPRKEPASFKRMNAKQLEAHIGRLDSFVSRDTQFVAGPRGARLDGALVQRNLQLQRAINRNREQGFGAVKDLHIPSFGTAVVEGKTVPVTAEMVAGQKPIHPTTGNPSTRAPHIPINIGPKSFPNNAQLRKSNKELEAKLTAESVNKNLVRDKKIASKFLRTISKINKSAELKEVREMYKTLTPGQFNFLWNYTDYADISSFDYEIAKGKLHDPKALSQYNDAFNTQIQQMNIRMKEVKNLDL